MKRSIALAAILAGVLLSNPAYSVDPGRSRIPNQSVPQPQDPFINPALMTTTPSVGINPGLFLPTSTSTNNGLNPNPTVPNLLLPQSTIDEARTRGYDSNGYPLGTSPASGASGVTPSFLPPGQQNPDNTAKPNRWKLGVYSKDTDTGVQIMKVVAGSAADRAGLEMNDVIVCVSGYQVGYVNGVLYDCAREFERNADPNGWVNLLVRNSRNGQLVNLPLQLDSRFERIDGSITYRENYSLPRNSVATIELREILRPGAPPVTLARNTVAATQVPIPFSIEYEPSLIDPRRTYVLEASITSGNQTYFVTRRSVQVLQPGQSRNVALLVESTISSPTASNPGYVSRDQQIEQIVRWFREYLQRDPRNLELVAWQRHVDRGGSLTDAQAQILSMPEFYNRCDSNDVRYIQQLHEVILGKQPTQEELNYWLGRMQVHNRLRPEVAREFLEAVGIQR